MEERGKKTVTRQLNLVRGRQEGRREEEQGLFLTLITELHRPPLLLPLPTLPTLPELSL